jgi:two-component system sensor histidine kinase UhpB
MTVTEMSLRLRIVLAVALLFLTGSAVGAALGVWQADRVLREELYAAMAGGRLTAAGALQNLSRSRDPASDLRVIVTSFDGGRHLKATLADASGATLMVSHPLPVRPAPDWFAALFHPDVTAERFLTPGGGTLTLAPVAANDIAAVWTEFAGVLTVLGGSFALGAVLLWFTVGRALRPLSDFSAAFERIGAGDYAAKVAEAGPPELARVGGSVNQMAARLEAMQARTRRLEDQIATLQDEERADLARDLHDEIGPHLFAVNVDAAMAKRLIEEGRPAEAVPQVESIQSAVAHLQRLVRDILGRLRPSELLDLGLAAAIGELVAFWRARHPGIAFEVAVADDEALDLSEAAREAAYRVVQESLANAVRHGRPGRIAIKVARTAGGAVTIDVTDDGAPSGEPSGGGFGLKGMRERVSAQGGTLEIERGAGWRVIARLPARHEIAEETV